MAPMIDMVFLLLVFFMTVSTLAKDARPEIELAESVTAAVPEAVPPRDVVTVIKEGGDYHYFWQTKPVTLEEVGTLLEESADGGGQVLLRGASDLPWEAWQGMLQACRTAGTGDIIFATYED